jgi:hypothetical protein
VERICSVTLGVTPSARKRFGPSRWVGWMRGLAQWFPGRAVFVLDDELIPARNLASLE